MTDHLTPEAIARAHAEAEDREAERIAAERTERQQGRSQRRKLGESKAREVQRRWQTGTRAQQREARYYAEAWWQAIRAWQTKEVRELVPRTKVGSGGAGRMTPIVGNYSRGQAYLTYTEVRTPMGLVSESALARAISESGCPALERARKGSGLRSLLRQDGYRWADGGDEAAEQILRVAQLLGDENVKEPPPCS